MEEEKKVDFSGINFENKKIDMYGIEFHVNPVIDWDTQQFIISSYLERFFGERDNPFGKFVSTNRFLAESALRSDLIKRMTDVDWELLPERVILCDDFFNSVTHEITNWFSFRVVLDDILFDAISEKELNKSLGVVLDYAITKIVDLTESLDENTFKGVSEQIKEIGEQLKESRLSRLMDEAQKQTKE